MPLPRLSRSIVFRSVGLAALIAVTAACAVGEDKKADPATASSDGWVQLFNGKDLTGWMLPNPPSGQFSKVTEKKNDEGKVVALIGTLKGKDGKDGQDVTLWRVQDGLLIGGGPMSHLFTVDGDYDDFDFRVELKINDHGNSGLFFRAGVRPGVPKGYECQVNATHGDPVKSGSIYPNGEFGLDKYKKDTCVMNTAAHKPDVFYTEEIVCAGPKITTLVDGKKQIEWTDPEHRFKKGHFALQGHDPGSVMTFKKVEVKRAAK